MVVRRGSGKAMDTSVEALVERLPDRFLAPVLEVADGNMVGLSQYMRDLDQWLREQMRIPPRTDPRSAGYPHPPVVQLMTAIQCLPSEWYRTAFREG